MPRSSLGQPCQNNTDKCIILLLLAVSLLYHYHDNIIIIVMIFFNKSLLLLSSSSSSPSLSSSSLLLLLLLLSLTLTKNYIFLATNIICSLSTLNRIGINFTFHKILIYNNDDSTATKTKVVWCKMLSNMFV